MCLNLPLREHEEIVHARHNANIYIEHMPSRDQARMLTQAAQECKLIGIEKIHRPLFSGMIHLFDRGAIQGSQIKLGKVVYSIQFNRLDPMTLLAIALTEEKNHLLLRSFEEQLAKCDQRDGAIVLAQIVTKLCRIVDLEEFRRDDHRDAPMRVK